MGPGESDSSVVVVVRLGGTRGSGRVFQVLQLLGIAADPTPAEQDLVPADGLGFRIGRERIAEVMLALEGAGFPEVKAYEGLPEA